MERVDDREPEAGQGDDDDEEDRDGGGGARDRADLLAGDLRERRPPRRVEAQRMMKSWTAPARQTPQTSQMSPGAQPNCAASTGPISGPAPVIAAK